MDVPKINRRMWLWRELFVLSPFWLTTSLIILQLLDCVTTLFVTLTIGHNRMESNPIIRFVLDHPNGAEWFAAIKVTACVLMAVIVPWSLRISPGYAWVWRAVAIGYLAIVLGNFVGVAIVCMQF